MPAKMRDGIVQRGATWSYKIQVTDPVTGVRKAKWISRGPDGAPFRTRTAAKAARDEARDRVNKGTWSAQRKLTVTQYLTEWLEGQRTQLKRSTWSSYRDQVHRYVMPTIGGQHLQSLTAAGLNSLYAQLLERGGRDGRPLAVRTVRYVHAVLHTALADAVKQQLLTSNVASIADAPRRAHAPAPAMSKPAEKQLQAWTAEQVRVFAEASDGSAMHDSFLLALNTGMRRGEVYGLTWDDVDLDQGRLHVRQAMATINHAVEISTPKSGKTRSFRIDPTTIAILRRRKAAQARDRLAWPGAWGNDLDLVFTREDGRHIHPSEASKVFKRTAERAGLPQIRYHDQRHTYATLALQAGVNIKVVSQRLGHATVQLTWDTYAHVLPDQDDEAAELFHQHVYGAGQ